jgi:hypothetical protein
MSEQRILGPRPLGDGGSRAPRSGCLASGSSTASRLFTFDRRDATWLRDHLRASRKRGEWGMSNPGQKLLAWGLTIAGAVVIYTGIHLAGSRGPAV